MSTIRVDNFGPSAGGTTYSARGIAKAWVNFNGTGTIAARDSENVSSVTDGGAGYYGISFTNIFDGVGYCVSAINSPENGARDCVTDSNADASGGVSRTASFVWVLSYNTGVSINDALFVNIIAFGDLA